MQKSILILFVALLAGSFQSIDAAQQTSREDCFTAADTMARFESDLLDMSYEEEYETFIFYYDACRYA